MLYEVITLLILSNLLGSNKKGNLTADQVQSAKIIYKSGSDLLHLINEILDLSKANKVIDKKNRAQHFAIGDFLYSKNTGKTKASDTTNLRKGKWTWHHMPDPYKMVLVDMTVHAKHGHNGGVYLW